MKNDNISFQLIDTNYDCLENQIKRSLRMSSKLYNCNQEVGEYQNNGLPTSSKLNVYI